MDILQLKACELDSFDAMLNAVSPFLNLTTEARVIKQFDDHAETA